MNYLAHSYLSFGYDDILLGNFIADAIRGKAINEYTPAIIKGIQLHRLIDEFTDHHAVVKDSKNRLAEKYGKYDSVIMDILYDFILAKNWEKFASIPLPKHASKVYALLDQNINILPEKIAQMLPYMKGQNWLVAYGTKEGIAQSLKGMSSRASFPSHMDEATEDLEKNLEELTSDFMIFFPQIIALCKSFVEKNRQ